MADGHNCLVAHKKVFPMGAPSLGHCSTAQHTTVLTILYIWLSMVWLSDNPYK